MHWLTNDLQKFGKGKDKTKITQVIVIHWSRWER